MQAINRHDGGEKGVLSSLLQTHDCSILASTLASHRVIQIKSPTLSAEPVLEIKHVAGIALQDDVVAVAGFRTVELFDRGATFQHHLKSCHPGANAEWKPVVTYHAGNCDLHDLHFGTHELWVVNTKYSCLCSLSERRGLTYRWKPHFISQLVPEDRCHMNGLAMACGEPKYITAVGRTDQAKAWRSDQMAGGILMDVPSNEIVVTGLGMPHTPRIFPEGVFILESAKQRLLVVDPVSGHIDVVSKLPGFPRGMVRLGDHL